MTAPTASRPATADERPDFSRARSGAVPRFGWRLQAFAIERRANKAGVAVPARARRVLVYAPYPAAALSGAGVGKDEIARPVLIRVSDFVQMLGRPSREEIADFFDTLGNALATGGGMSLALNMAARMSRSPKMRGIIGALHEMARHGEDLHVAMRCFPEVFSPMQLAMVEAAAATGWDRAGGLLVTLSRRLQADGKVWSKLAGAIAYPASLIVLTAVGAVILEIWALPPMVELFRTLGGRLPPITQFFYDVAQFVRTRAFILGPVIGMAAVAAAVALPRFVRSKLAQRLATRVVLIGPIVQSLALVRALGTFILLKQSGAKVREQFMMAAAAAGNCVVGEFFEACYARIVSGESVEEAFTAERHRLGEDGTRIAGKMEVGMAGADLPTLLERTVQELNDRAEARLNVLPNAIRWPLLIVCCVMIGAVALAIVLPYPNLIADISQQQTRPLK